MTLEKNIYLLFGILMNFLTLSLMFRVHFRLPSGNVKNSLYAYSLFYLGWMNFIISLRVFEFSQETANLIVKILLSSVSLMILSYLYFVFSLTDPGQLKKKRNLLFPLNEGILILLVFLDLIQTAEIVDGVYKPHYETVFPYFAVTLTLTAFYGVYFLFMRLKSSTDEFTVFQYKYIFTASLITTVAMTLTQGVLPVFFGRNVVTFYSNFIWPAVFIFFVIKLLSRGRILFLQKTFRNLLIFPAFQIEKNMSEIRKLIYTLKKIFAGSSGEAKNSFSLHLPNDKLYKLNLSGKNGRQQDRWLISENMNSAKYINRISGLLDVIMDLENENKYLEGLIVKAKAFFPENIRMKPVEVHPALLAIEGSMKISENIKRNQLQFSENKKSFGKDIWGKSVSFYEILSRIRTFAPSNQPVMMIGETGSGKAMFCRAMHFYRKGSGIYEVSCMGMNADEMKGIIQKFLTAPEKDVPGIIIRHLDMFKREDFGIFEPLFSDFNHKRFVYFTANSDILMNLETLKPALKNRFNQIQISTKPLRDMKEDIISQVLVFIAQNTDENLNGYQYMSPEFIEGLMGYDWPGNSYELNLAVQRALLENVPPVLKLLPLNMEEGLMDDFENDISLSPLEQSEKIVISRYLKKNNFNKSKTKRELKITINTLNSKMKRYGINAVQ